MMVGCESAGKERMSPFLSTGSCPQSRWAAQVTRQNRSSCQTFTAGFFSFCSPLTFSGSLDCLLPASLPPSLSPLTSLSLLTRCTCTFFASNKNWNHKSAKLFLSRCITVFWSLTRLIALTAAQPFSPQGCAGCKTTIARCERSSTGPVLAARFSFIFQKQSASAEFFPFSEVFFFFFLSASCVTVCSIRGCITHFIRGCVRHQRCRNSWLIPKGPKVQHYLEELAG